MIAIRKFNRQQIATTIALAFHISGFIAIALFKNQFFVQLTWLNLLVSAALIFYTQEKINGSFLVFVLAASIIGFSAEWLGINKQLLFGNYTYGNLLGPKWQGVPLLIGLQWFVIIYCCCISMQMLHDRLKRNQPDLYNRYPKWWTYLSRLSDPAFIAVLFDWAMEPVAQKLGYWKWKDNEIPISNYTSWFCVSILIIVIFNALSFKKQNMFALHLLLIQFMFFLLLRTFL